MPPGIRRWPPATSWRLPWLMINFLAATLVVKALHSPGNGRQTDEAASNFFDLSTTGLAAAYLSAAVVATAAAAALWVFQRHHHLQRLQLCRQGEECIAAAKEDRTAHQAKNNPVQDVHPLVQRAEQASAARLMAQDSGLITPFAAIMPLFDQDEDGFGPGNPSPHMDSPPGPALTDAQGRPQGGAAASRQGSLQAVGSGGVPGMQPRSRLASSIGGWVASLLGRRWSAPAPAPADAAGGVLQPRPQPPQPQSPLPIRTKGSLESLPSPHSSAGSLQSLALLEPASPTQSALNAESSLADLLLSEWEVSPEEIEIMRRPDGSEWELGVGGFGRVVKALRNGVQPVAVKVLSAVPSEVRDASLSEFIHEIMILKACKDPNIVAFLGACLQQSATMLVTEYCEGGSLTRNILRGRIGWYHRGKKVALDVARGLVFLHSRRIVHFDLKSANVLLTRDGTAKIADVGMAKIIGREFSAVSGSLGTLAWASPEMLLGARCTEKSDIYSFGVLLWELCTGETPMRGQLRDVRPPGECPYEVRDLILHCLDPNPKARPTALRLVELLQAAPAHPPGELPPAGRSLSRAPAAPPAGPALSPPPRQLRTAAAAAPACPVAPPGEGGQPPYRAATLPPPVREGPLLGPHALETSNMLLHSPAVRSAAVCFSDAALPSSPFAVAAGAGSGAARRPLPLLPRTDPSQRAQQGAEPTQHSAASPPRPPTPLGGSSSCECLWQADTCSTLRAPHSAAGAQQQLQSLAEAGAAPWEDQQSAPALHSCPLSSALSHQMQREHNSPAVLGSGELSLGHAALSQHSTQLQSMLEQHGMAGASLDLSSWRSLGQSQYGAASYPLHSHNMPHPLSTPELASMHSAPGQGWGGVPAGHGSPGQYRTLLAQLHGIATSPYALTPHGQEGVPLVRSSAPVSSADLRRALARPQDAAASPEGGKEDVWGRLLFNM